MGRADRRKIGTEEWDLRLFLVTRWSSRVHVHMNRDEEIAVSAVHSNPISQRPTEQGRSANLTVDRVMTRGVLSAHERHVLWRIADLLHVPQGAYVHARMRAEQQAGGPTRGEP